MQEIKHPKFIIITTLLTVAVVMSSCARPSKPEPDNRTPTETQPVASETFTPEPSATAILEPSSTPTIKPIQGRLFFDLNGSGLQDEASFNYNSSRLTDDLQPLHHDLQEAVENYLIENPETEDGDLITIEEPGLSGYEVCANDECTVTDEAGDFFISNPKNNRSILISISDPNEGNPAFEMRYINQWKKAVTVPEYTKDIDVTTMTSLEIVPICDEDAEALVCKQDEDTLLVREQNLNDTSVVLISEEYDLINGRVNEIGLMQGFLTLPFDQEQIGEIPFIFDYFDIIGYRIFNDQNTFQSTMDGQLLSYDGKANQGVDISLWGRLRNFEELSLVGDSHTGLDFLVKIGSVIISGAQTSSVWYTPIGQINLMVYVGSNNYDNCYGHMAVSFLEINQENIYRGQVIGLSGDEGNERIPQLHFHVAEGTRDGWYYLDPFRCIVVLDPLPENFWGNPVSMWTCDNTPQFSR